MNILGLISSPVDPASRARILQYIPYFGEKGHSLSCKYYHPLREADPPGWARQLKKITGISEWRSTDLIKAAGRIPLLFTQSGYDLIWQNRLIQLQHLFWEKKLKKPVAFDFDDAIWINEGEEQVKKKIGMSSVIFAGNNYLAEFASKYNPRVRIVPTTIDTRTICPLPVKKEPFTIGWAGSFNNQASLDLVREVLLAFIRNTPGSRLLVISDKPYGNIPFDNERILFKTWQAEKENELLNECTVGIMPMEDNEWTRGKCSYKMLQYMACGKPVIVSPVGTNKEILAAAEVGFGPADNEGWMKALLALKNDPALYARLSANAVRLVQEKYSAAGWTPVLLQYLSELL